MQHSKSRRRLRAAFAAITLLSLTAMLTIATSWPAPPPDRVDPNPTPVDVATVVAIDVASAPPAPPTERTAAVETPTPVVAAPTFEERIERLVDIGTRTAEFARNDEADAATESDREAREEFAALLASFPDCGERAIVMLADAAANGASDDARTMSRRFVLQLTIGAECSRREVAATAAGDRSRLDPLVRALLDVMPQATAIAEVGDRVLSHQPYLRAAHEPAVLELVRFASEGRFPREIATRLLLTLWDNLQRSGERSPEELSRAAMLLLADADPSQRTVACRQLLGDPRYRPMVLAWLRQRGDRSVAAEVSGIAARELPPADALVVLRELAPLLQRSPNAFMVLGARAPDLLADTYRELLASNTQPGVRTDLVAGIGFAAAPASLEIADFALQNDPSPEVKVQAAFAMTASGDIERGERAIARLLDEPTIANDPVRLGALVLAMQNLEAGGGINAIDRLAQRLRTMALSDASRQQLEAMIVRSVPDGRVSSHAGTPSASASPTAR